MVKLFEGPDGNQGNGYGAMLRELERLNERSVALDVIGTVWQEYAEFLERQMSDQRWLIEFAQFHHRVLAKATALVKVEWNWGELNFETTAFFDDGGKHLRYALEWKPTSDATI